MAGNPWQSKCAAACATFSMVGLAVAVSCSPVAPDPSGMPGVLPSVTESPSSLTSMPSLFATPAASASSTGPAPALPRDLFAEYVFPRAAGRIRRYKTNYLPSQPQPSNCNTTSAPKAPYQETVMGLRGTVAELRVSDGVLEATTSIGLDASGSLSHSFRRGACRPQASPYFEPILIENPFVGAALLCQEGGPNKQITADYTFERISAAPGSTGSILQAGYQSTNLVFKVVGTGSVQAAGRVWNTIAVRLYEGSDIIGVEELALGPGLVRRELRRGLPCGVDVTVLDEFQE